MNRFLLRVACCTALISGPAALASAQTFEAVGIRAQGMAGAFVAIADDATATWWNPAGLASGAFFSAVVERGAASAPNDDATLGVAFVVPSLGISYYRLRTSEMVAPGAVAGTVVRLPTVVVNEAGISFGQSIGNHVVLASTLRLINADQTSGDIDIGAMLRMGVTRVGLVVKHVHQPAVTGDGISLPFDRQVRLGVAYVPHPGKTVTVNAALDADLTTTPTAFGDVRHLAGGGELWFQRSLGVRAGVSVNTVDQRRSSFSAGASAAIQKGLFLDAQLTRGDDPVKRGWGIDLRVAF